MNKVFNENYEKFYDKDLIVIPLENKNPEICKKNWQFNTFNSPQKIGDNMGLLTGIRSKVICIDIDLKDSAHKEAIYKLLPPLYSGKRGNREKGDNYFFAFNNEDNRKIRLNGDVVVELLSTGNQTVIPPSMHENGYEYEWLGIPLHEVDIDDLPLLPPNFMDDVARYLQPFQDNLPRKNTTGRHNTLVSQCFASFSNGRTKEETINELTEYDNKNHNPPYFTDEGETHKGKDAANKLYESVLKTATQRNFKPSVVDVDFPREKPMFEEAKKNFKSLAKLEGFGAVLFDDLYKNSPIQRSQLCHMNVLNLLSILIGNKIFYKGTAANLYLYGVAPSGFGKDFSFKRSKDLLTACGLKNLIASSSPTSDSVVLTALTKKGREQCYFINEAETLLKRITSDRMNFGLRECLTDLFDYPGRAFTPKLMMTENKNGKDLTSIGDVFSPYLNVLMTSTTSAFNRYAAQNVFETGFGSRFLYFFEDRYKEQAYVDDFNPPFPGEIIKAVKNFKGDEPFLKVNDSDQKFTPYNVKVTNEAKAYDRSLHLKLEKEKRTMQDHKFFSIITRKYYFINKFALLHHCMVNPNDYLEKPLDFKSIEWAEKDVNAIVHNMLVYLNDSVAESDYGRKANHILRYIKSRTIKGEATSRKAISNRFQDIKKPERDLIINDLTEQESIFIKDKMFYASKR